MKKGMSQNTPIYLLRPFLGGRGVAPPKGDPGATNRKRPPLAPEGDRRVTKKSFFVTNPPSKRDSEGIKRNFFCNPPLAIFFDCQIGYPLLQ